MLHGDQTVIVRELVGGLAKHVVLVVLHVAKSCHRMTKSDKAGV